MNRERGNLTSYETLQTFQLRRQESSDLLRPPTFLQRIKKSAGRVGDEIWRDLLRFLKRITGGRCPQGVHLGDCRCGLEVRARNAVIGKESKIREETKPAA